MGWLKRLAGRTVALDSAPLIYFVERHSAFHARIRPFFQALQRGDFEVVASAIAVTEVLVHPLKHDNIALADEFRKIFMDTNNFQTISITPEIAETAARVRATHGIRTPDALHIATAIHCKADFFLTNDERLAVLSPPTVMTLSDLTE